MGMEPLRIQEVGAALAFCGIFALIGAGFLSLAGDITGWFSITPYFDLVLKGVLLLMASGCLMLAVGAYAPRTGKQKVAPELEPPAP